ncbi:B3 domain-containing protein [Striga hermonthica]|uniref:B3 domain-containing protein n=1 Tax=Striga hermonthica TaxID=68872 RepID=A0A9N7R277_STRHE|nr:B3 domain-containing protein [Striga hermonthica]
MKKLSENFHEIYENQNSSSSENCSTEDRDTMDCPYMEKRKKRKKKSIMLLESSKKGSSRKPRSVKSKDKQVCTKNSKKSRSVSRKRTRQTDLYDDIESKFSVMERADRVLARLESELELPFFLKCMLPSNVSHGFWLHLPKKFCSLHLPNHDTSIILVDEWGNEYKTSYLLERHGLSAGWRGFSIAHRLLKGDILIFHLTAPCRLQVHIVRVHGSDVVSAALCLMELDAFGRGEDADLEKKDKKKRKRTTKYVEPFLPDISTLSENGKGKNVLDQFTSNANGFSSEFIQDSETAVRPQSKNAIYYPDPSFLHEHSFEGVVCR